MNSHQKYYATSAEIGVVQVVPGYELVVYDDGCDDPDVSVCVRDVDGNEYPLSLMLAQVRAENGDERFERMLANSSKPDDSGTSSYQRPTRFICDECGLTCPGKWNATLDEHRDVCKNCVD